MPLSREKIFCIALFLLCTCLNLGLSSVGWNHNLREAHEFRQTQTALTARYIQKEGWSLAAPLPLFGPPWSAPMEFPLYQACVAKVSTWTGLSLESSGRFVALFFLYLSLPAFFLLLGHLAIPAHRRWLLLGLVLITPVYLYYSRSFMIESAALCSAAWFLHAFARALESRRSVWVLAAVVLGCAAGLVKVTTFAVFLCPAFALTLQQLWRCRPQSGRSTREWWSTAAVALVIVLPALAVALAWVSYGDAVKHSNPLSQFLASTQLRDWNYGTFALRLDPKFWASLWHHSSVAVLQIVVLALFALLATLTSRSGRLRVAVLVLCFLTGPLVFSNLYYLHDYYFYATGVFLLAGVALAWSELLDRTSLPIWVRWGVIVVTLGAQVFGFTQTYFRVQTRPDLAQPELGRVLGQITQPGDVLLIHGLAWNPGIPYASDRKAIMVNDDLARDPSILDEVLRRLPADSVAAMVVAGPLRADPSFVQRLVTKLDLQPEPILRDENTDVFLARRRMASAVPRLEKTRLQSLSLTTLPDAEIDGVKVRRYLFDDLADPAEVAMFSPRPREILAPFGLSTATVEGSLVFNAHAPTEITMQVPPNARTLTADYGILPDAFTGEKTTDGVLFRIERIAEDGTTAVLHEMFLQPASHPEHRARQSIELALPSGTRSDLVLRTTGGPANNISFDWGYWTAVKIKE